MDMIEPTELEAHAGHASHEPMPRLRLGASVLAGFCAIGLSIAHLGGANASKHALTASIAATDNWAWYEAKAQREQQQKNFAFQLEIQLAEGRDSLNDDAKTIVKAEIDKAQSDARRYASDPSTGAGREQLQEAAKRLEAERDRAQRQEETLELAETFLQVAVVLAGLGAIALSIPLIGIAGLFALAGAGVTAAGYLHLPLPF